MPQLGLLCPPLEWDGISPRDILASPKSLCACARHGNCYHFHHWWQRRQSLRQLSRFPDRNVEFRSSVRTCRVSCATSCPLSNARLIVPGRGSGQFRRRAREWRVTEAEAPRPRETGLRRGPPMLQRLEISCEKPSCFSFYFIRGPCIRSPWRNSNLGLSV